MGESFGIYKLGFDEETMPFVTSVNVACGFHASDPSNMQKSVRLAKKYNVAIGAHPSYPDLVGFGRRILMSTPDEIKADFIYQIGALQGFCKAEGVAMQHVKAHGAIANVAEKDLAVATAIAKAIKAIDPTLYMVCLANSALVEAAQNVGIPYVEEAYADRAYTNVGGLVSRKLPGAVIHDVEEIANRVLMMVKDNKVMAIDGTEVPVAAQTICVHGDTPGAVEMIKGIREKLGTVNIKFQPFGQRSE